MATKSKPFPTIAPWVYRKAKKDLLKWQGETIDRQYSYAIPLYDKDGNKTGKIVFDFASGMAFEYYQHCKNVCAIRTIDF